MGYDEPYFLRKVTRTASESTRRAKSTLAKGVISQGDCFSFFFIYSEYHFFISEKFFLVGDWFKICQGQDDRLIGSPLLGRFFYCDDVMGRRDLFDVSPFLLWFGDDGDSHAIVYILNQLVASEADYIDFF